jgi:hypothetical protein
MPTTPHPQTNRELEAAAIIPLHQSDALAHGFFTWAVLDALRHGVSNGNGRDRLWV